jgi:hypothetical protein
MHGKGILKYDDGGIYDGEWKDDKRISYGVIAQEIENILPELVKETDGIKSVSYIPIIAFLIDAVVELSNKFDKINNITE